MTATLPSITMLSRSHGNARYRLEGGLLAPDWEAGLCPGRVAWCEITIRDGSDHLGSFGGEVWPSAWPDLFECGPGSAQTGPWTRVTPAGRAALDAASPSLWRSAACPDRMYVEVSRWTDLDGAVAEVGLVREGREGEELPHVWTVAELAAARIVPVLVEGP